jgi:hypothetical protein
MSLTKLVVEPGVLLDSVWTEEAGGTGAGGADSNQLHPVKIITVAKVTYFIAKSSLWGNRNNGR